MSSARFLTWRAGTMPPATKLVISWRPSYVPASRVSGVGELAYV
jgi:hypothetical protein